MISSFSLFPACTQSLISSQLFLIGASLRVFCFVFLMFYITSLFIFEEVFSCFTGEITILLTVRRLQMTQVANVNII